MSLLCEERRGIVRICCDVAVQTITVGISRDTGEVVASHATDLCWPHTRLRMRRLTGREIGPDYGYTNLPCPW